MRNISIYLCFLSICVVMNFAHAAVVIGDKSLADDEIMIDGEVIKIICTDDEIKSFEEEIRKKKDEIQLLLKKDELSDLDASRVRNLLKEKLALEKEKAEIVPHIPSRKIINQFNKEGIFLKDKLGAMNKELIDQKLSEPEYQSLKKDIEIRERDNAKMSSEMEIITDVIANTQNNIDFLKKRKEDADRASIPPYPSYPSENFIERMFFNAQFFIQSAMHAITSQEQIQFNKKIDAEINRNKETINELLNMRNALWSPRYQNSADIKDMKRELLDFNKTPDIAGVEKKLLFVDADRGKARAYCEKKQEETQREKFKKEIEQFQQEIKSPAMKLFQPPDFNGMDASNTQFDAPSATTNSSNPFHLFNAPPVPSSTPDIAS